MSTERAPCDSTLRMDDPWYGVWCNKPKGHRGKHRAEWTDKTDGQERMKPDSQWGKA